VRPSVRDRQVYVSRNSLRSRVSARKSGGESARERERASERGEEASKARALHDEPPLPRATATRFKSVALRPSSRRYFARYSLLSQSRRAVVRAIVVLGPRDVTYVDRRPRCDSAIRARSLFFFLARVSAEVRRCASSTPAAVTRVARDHRRWMLFRTSPRLPREISALKDRPVSARTQAHAGGAARCVAWRIAVHAGAAPSFR